MSLTSTVSTLTKTLVPFKPAYTPPSIPIPYEVLRPGDSLYPTATRHNLQTLYAFQSQAKEAYLYDGKFKYRVPDTETYDKIGLPHFNSPEGPYKIPMLTDEAFNAIPSGLDLPHMDNDFWSVLGQTFVSFAPLLGKVTLAFFTGGPAAAAGVEVNAAQQASGNQPKPIHEEGPVDLPNAEPAKNTPADSQIDHTGQMGQGLDASNTVTPKKDTGFLFIAGLGILAGVVLLAKKG